MLAGIKAEGGRPKKRLNGGHLMKNEINGITDACRGINEVLSLRSKVLNHFQRLLLRDILAERKDFLCRMAHKAWKNI
jgi:hypothetical protein